MKRRILTFLSVITLLVCVIVVAAAAADANGAFTAANSNAAAYLDAAYFTAVLPGFNITEENGVLYCTQN